MTVYKTLKTKIIKVSNEEQLDRVERSVDNALKRKKITEKQFEKLMVEFDKVMKKIGVDKCESESEYSADDAADDPDYYPSEQSESEDDNEY
jgi:hypothetical protein